jgi:hypothetical protein
MRSCSRSAAGVCATVRAGFVGLAEVGDAVWNRLISPQPASTKPAHNNTGAAQRRRPVPVSRRPANPATAATRMSGELILANHFNLPHPEHLDSRTAARLDPATDTNPSILEGLRRDPGSLERCDHAP